MEYAIAFCIIIILIAIFIVMKPKQGMPGNINISVTPTMPAVAVATPATPVTAVTASGGTTTVTPVTAAAVGATPAAATSAAVTEYLKANKNLERFATKASTAPHIFKKFMGKS
jgi:hypothetical protein